MADPEARGQRLPAAARIRGTKEIRAAFREGRRHASGAVEVFARPSPAGRPRLAVVVPRHGRTIVERNRVRRRLREIARRDWLPEAVSRGVEIDVVVRAGPDAYVASFDELRDSLCSGLEAVSWDEASSSG